MNSPVRLTRIRPERNEWRFYRLDIWPDLFGGFTLIREWGRIGTGGQSRHETYATYEEAESASTALAAMKQKRGYSAC
jgi:predicted DNA-binding WGR domain protein